MNPDPLAGLRDWHLPEPISWWPPAPGWWLLAVAGVIGASLLLHWLWRRYRRAAVARAARRELAAIELALAAGGDERRYIADLSRLLRRLALVRYPRERVAGLSGWAWLEFLDATGGEGGFTRDAGRMLVEDAYRPETQPRDAHALEDLGRLAARWIAANRGVRA